MKGIKTRTRVLANKSGQQLQDDITNQTKNKINSVLEKKGGRGRRSGYGTSQYDHLFGYRGGYDTFKFGSGIDDPDGESSDDIAARLDSIGKDNANDNNAAGYKDKPSNFNEEVDGNFENPNELRQELGLDVKDINDEQAWQLIAADAHAHRDNIEKEKQKLIAERDRIAREKAIFEQKAREADQLRSSKNMLESEINIERNKRRLYEDVLNPYSLVNSQLIDPITGLSYIARERLKEQVKRELREESENEKKWKKIDQALNRSTKNKSRVSSRSRAITTSKSKLKSKSKSKSKSKKK